MPTREANSLKIVRHRTRVFGELPEYQTIKF